MPVPDQPSSDAPSRDAPDPDPAVDQSAAMSEPEAIFVVGVSRSGTTLMRQVLGKHSRIAIADENHYLGHILPRQGARHDFGRVGDLRDDDAVRRLAAFIYSPAFQRGTRLRDKSAFWRWLVRQIPQEELEGRLLAGERSERGVFTAVLRAYADRRGKAVMGEKTPAHLRWADTLLDWYPRGRIVHMMRDPRAVYVSELRRRSGNPESLPYRWLVMVPPLLRGFILLEVAWAWADAVSRHRVLARRYPDRYRLVRFEDLVREPGPTVDGVCAFLGVAPERRMLRQKVVSKGVRLGDAGFDVGATDRWRTTIGARDLRWLGRLLGRRLPEMGYSRT